MESDSSGSTTLMGCSPQDRVIANIERDHWHRTGDDPGRPYAFATSDRLLADFFAEVGGFSPSAALTDRGQHERQTRKGLGHENSAYERS